MIFNRRAVRKALERPLAPTLVAAQACLDPSGKPQVQWGNLVLQTKGLKEWVRFTVHFATPRVLGMGQTGLTQDSGLAIATVFTPMGTGPDRNDTIAGIIETAYPYNACLIFNGVKVILAETQHADGAQDGPWWTTSIKVVWNRWRNQG